MGFRLEPMIAHPLGLMLQHYLSSWTRWWWQKHRAGLAFARIFLLQRGLISFSLAAAALAIATTVLKALTPHPFLPPAQVIMARGVDKRGGDGGTESLLLCSGLLP